MPVTMTGAFAQQPENKIPDWIKTTAGWWADGSIDGTSFVQGIQYLIKEDIIIIPETTQGSGSGTNEIPDWVKNNAGWWAEGAIDESSFVQSMQFLIEEGVVQISSTTDSTPQEIPEPNITPIKDPQTNNAQEKNNQNDKDKTKTVKDFSTILNDEKFLSISEKIKNKHDRMALKANTDGAVRVIVELDVDFKFDLTDQEKIDKKQTIKNKQNSLKNILSSNGIIELYNLKHSPLIVMTVNPTVLDELISSGLVKTIHEDIGLLPSLDTTVPKVGATTVHASGVTGAGTAVAILDSGIDRTHAFFAPAATRIVSEACYTANNATASNPFGCPGGLETGDGSAAPCTSNSACFHGTHVAGIAAGSHAGTPSSGVAKGVGIVAIQVFTVLPTSSDSSCPSGPGCMVAFLADIVRGLDRVYFLADTGDPDPINIVAVNFSLGSTFAFTNSIDCDNGVVAGVLKGPIDALRNDLGIVTIAAAGNGGNPNALSSPACISSVVSVGSADDFDVVPKYSNIASFLDLLAPGGNGACTGAPSATCFIDNGSDDGIRSSILGNAFGNAFGTSMAAPHVTGAWALIKSSSDYPDPSIAEVLHVLNKTGLLLLEPSTGITKPRIQIDRAIDALIHLKDCTVNIVDIDNIIFGTSGDDLLQGTSLNDLIIGFAGNDAISGNEGNDCLFGNSGDDNLSGGIGNDYLNGSNGADSLRGDADNDIIFGGAGNDRLDGGLGDDELNGGPDNDSLSGRAGGDTLNGDGGSDILDGGDEDNSVDILNGGDGDDFLYGRGGIDTLDGGTGSDWCVPGDGETVSNCEIVS